MTTLRLLDGRVHDTVSVPRYRLEEGLVDIQAASGEASKAINHAADEIGQLHPAFRRLTTADTLCRYAEQEARRLAGEVTNCPDGLSGPSGDHAA